MTKPSILGGLPGSLPADHVPRDVDLDVVAESCINYLDRLCTENLTEDALWRDSFALTGSLRTISSAPTIESAWNDLSESHRTSSFKLVPGSSRIVASGSKSSWIEARFTFETESSPPTICSGFVSLVLGRDSQWRIWVLRTILEQLKGKGSVDVLQPQGAVVNPRTENVETSEERPTDYDCVIVGGGQSGLSTAGRLKAAGLSYVVLERNDRIGDNWRKRYDSVKMHNIREYAHLPFDRTFSPDYNQFLTKNDLARGHHVWVKKFGINIWLSTNLESGSWDSGRLIWNLNVLRKEQHHIITARHVVIAVGSGCQIPTMPHLSNREAFKGTILHSAEYTSADEWRGKAGVVVGCANTAHDVAEDMLNAGLRSVTMVQRGRTYVLPVEYFKKISEVTYNANFPTELADRMQFSSPAAISRLMAMNLLHGWARADSERFDALERAGFKVERFGDFQHHMSERQGGHYVDVGASAKIAKGLIKIKSIATIDSYTADGLRFSDGTETKADVIIFATGFRGNLRETVADLFGRQIADQVEDFWGLNAEGEIKGAFKPTGHPGMWYIGGGLGHSRYVSRFLGLQIQASVLGTPLAIYGETQ